MSRNLEENSPANNKSRSEESSICDRLAQDPAVNDSGACSLEGKLPRLDGLNVDLDGKRTRDLEPKLTSPRNTIEMVPEELSFGNLREALRVGCAAFEKPEDQRLIKLTYALYTIGMKTIPEKIFGKLGITSMIAYQLWRDARSGEAIAVSGLYTLKRTPEAAWLGWFGVVPGARRGGVGSQIVDKIESLTRARGYDSLMLYHSADDAKLDRFYGKLGYQREETSVAYGEKVTIRKKSLIDSLGARESLTS